MSNVLKFPDKFKPARLDRAWKSCNELPKSCEEVAEMAADLRVGVSHGLSDAQIRSILSTLQATMMSAAILTRAVKMNGLDYDAVWAGAYKSLLLGEGDEGDLELFAKSIDLSPSIEGLSS